jgi:tetratricopeptide (TPR) repeat protein
MADRQICPHRPDKNNTLSNNYGGDIGEQPSRRGFLSAAFVAAGLVPKSLPRIVEAAAYFHLGLDQFNRGDLEGAVASFTRAIEIDPTDERTLELRSVAYESLDDHERAIDDRTELIRLNPCPQNFLMRGLFAMGKFPAQAVADFTEVIRREPTHANSYLYRALVYEDSGDFYLALTDSLQHARLDPEDAWTVADDIARVRRLATRG